MPTSYEEILSDLNPENLNPNFQNYHQSSAVYLAQLATISYWEEGRLTDLCNKINERYPDSNAHCRFIHNEAADAQLVLWGNKDFLVIAFRGSEFTFLDWFNNAKISNYLNLSEHDEALHFLPVGHGGFRRSLINLIRDENLYNAIDAMISLSNLSMLSQSEFPIYTTGHSLGAGLSQLFIESLKRSNYNFSGAYHFAPPLSVSSSLKVYMIEAFGDIVYDIINYRDYVPRAGRLGTAHFGKFYRIHENGEIYKEEERYIKFKWWEYFKEIKVHKIINHLKPIKSPMNTASQINNRS